MSITNFPAMLVSETRGWTDIDQAHHTRRWYFRTLVLPLSLLPPLLFAYAEMAHPGAIFPLSLPPLTGAQLLVSGLVFYAAELVMVSYLAMLIQRMTLARDHDPGDDGPYALATVGMMPFWLGSLCLLVPSLGFSLAVMTLAGAMSILLIRHGARPLLHIQDEKVAHYVADTATLAGIVAWIGLLLVIALSLSMLLLR